MKRVTGEVVPRLCIDENSMKITFGKPRMVRRRKYRKPTKAEREHYLLHKEAARELVLARLVHFNQHYGYTYKRVAIRNQRTRWGSCSSNGNLNFNYRIVFLPAHLADYIIVHELCHLRELNHAQAFWNLVALQCPEYKKRAAELRTIKFGKL